MRRILITGGAGYVGAVLVPELLEDYEVVVYDLFLYGHVFDAHPNLTQYWGDIRDSDALVEQSRGCDVLMHLASTGAPGKIDPDLVESIDYQATHNIIRACQENDIERLIVASSTSTYGVKPLDVSVTEDASPDPVDDYGSCKMRSEVLICNSDLTSEVVYVRPSTLCGYSPRMRLDLAVNALTISALHSKHIQVFGGTQMRPTLNVHDMVRFYQLLLTAPCDKVDGQAFNVLYQNKTITDLAYLVRSVVGDGTEIEFLASDDDKRSYHVNADKMKDVLGFECEYTLEDGIRSVVDAYNRNLIPEALIRTVYHNYKRIAELGLK